MLRGGFGEHLSNMRRVAPRRTAAQNSQNRNDTVNHDNDNNNNTNNNKKNKTKTKTKNKNKNKNKNNSKNNKKNRDSNRGCAKTCLASPGKMVFLNCRNLNKEVGAIQDHMSSEVGECIKKGMLHRAAEESGVFRALA